jgi:hypothetical protein
VVSSKGVNVEAIGFAIPTQRLAGFVRSRTRKPFVVTGTLEAWEQEHRPLTALARKHPSYKDEFAVEIGDDVDRILLSNDGKSLFLLMGDAGVVSRFSIGERKVVGTFNADCELADMIMDARGSTIFLASPPKSSILAIDAGSMKLGSETSLPARPLRTAYVGGTTGHIVVTLAGRAPVLMNYYDLGRKKDLPAMSLDDFAGACASNGRWLCMARRRRLASGHAGGGYELIAYHTTSLKAIKGLNTARAAAKRGGFQPGAVKRISGLRKQVEAGRSVYQISGRTALTKGIPAPAIRFAGYDRVVFGCRIIKLGTTMKVLGTLEPGPYSTDERPEMKRHRDFYRYMDNVFSVSPDGRYAATGTHIYSLQTKKPVKKLPFPSTVHVFSKDGKSLYLCDDIRTRMYLLEDWEVNAE